jgi:hypothetical protein
MKTPNIARDPYAKSRGRLTLQQERAIVALGDHDNPLREINVKAVVGHRSILAELEDKGYAFTPRWAGSWTRGCSPPRAASSTDA